MLEQFCWYLAEGSAVLILVVGIRPWRGFFLIKSVSPTRFFHTVHASLWMIIYDRNNSSAVLWGMYGV